jgi:hypothetical protein
MSIGAKSSQSQEPADSASPKKPSRNMPGREIEGVMSLGLVGYFKSGLISLPLLSYHAYHQSQTPKSGIPSPLRALFGFQ